MRSKLILCLLLFLFILPISAQMNTSLVEPSAELLLAEAVSIKNDLEWQEASIFSSIVQEEIKLRYDIQDFSYEAISNLHDLLYPEEVLGSQFFENEDMAHAQIVTSHLNENSIEFDSDSPHILEFDDYVLEIFPTDFNGDGDVEFLIHTTWREFSHQAYWIFETTDLGVRKVESPTMWFNEACYFRSGCSGNAILLQIEDVNADGLNEVVIARGGYCGYGECGGNLEIWAWRDGIMREIAPRKDRFDLFWTDDSVGGVDILPPDGTWVFSNVDDDEALELIQDRTFDDNRGCVISNLRIFDWLPEQEIYESGDITETYEDTVGCGLRVGHISMLEGDYHTAISSYQRVIELIDPNTDDEYFRYARQYAQIRLAIAFALNGDVDDAIQQIEMASEIEPVAEVIHQMILSLATYLDNQNALLMCSAVHDSLMYSPENDYVNDFLFQQVAGLDDVSNRPRTYVGLQFGSAQSGCDVSGYALRLMQSDGVEALKDFAEIVKVITFDINDDGIDDSIQWFDLIAGGYFFLSNAEGFTISQASYSMPNDNFSYEVQYLPDDRLALLSIRNNPSENVCSLNDSNYGRLYIDVLTDENRLINLNSFYICNEISLENYDLSSGQLNVWDYFGEEFTSIWSDGSYTRNSDSDETTTVEELIAERGLFGCGQELEFCALYAELEYALEIIAIYFDNREDYPENRFLDLGLVYYQAVLLEQLGRNDEALIAYQELSESDTIWGQMASLHLAPQT